MSEGGQIRRTVGGDDLFASGHQIVAARTYKRSIPKWTLSDKAIRKVILRAFPKLATDPIQRKGAARWASVIHLYFRMRYTRAQIALEIDSSEQKIHGVVRSILRVSKGLRANGSGKLRPDVP